MQLVFTKTRVLSVKVSTLKCFLALVGTLDQVRNYILEVWYFSFVLMSFIPPKTSLTQKLVPLLAKIKTKGMFSNYFHVIIPVTLNLLVNRACRHGIVFRIYGLSHY